MTTTIIAGRRVPIALRSACAVVSALVGVALVTTLTDQIFHELLVYPPWGQPMHESGDNLLALSYRIFFGTLGGYVAARLAPRAPLAHAAALGLVSIVLTVAGTAAVQASMGDVGPYWYPFALAITALPCTLVGGRLAARRCRG